MRQDRAVSPQLCRQLQGSLLSMRALGKGPDPLRRSLAGGTALIGGVVTRLGGLGAVALQHVCHGGGESSLSAMPAQLLHMCSFAFMHITFAVIKTDTTSDLNLLDLRYSKSVGKVMQNLGNAKHCIKCDPGTN